MKRTPSLPFARRRWTAGLSLVCALLLSGCAGWQAHREGRERIGAGDIEGGFAKLAEAVRAAPENVEYRRSQTTLRERIAADLSSRAQAALSVEAFDVAEQAYQQWQRIDPGNPRPTTGLEQVAMLRRHAALRAQAQASIAKGDTASAQDVVAAVLRENPSDRRGLALSRTLALAQRERTASLDGTSPKLKAAYRKPVSLSYRDASVQQVFESLKVASGLNFMFDRDVRPDIRVSLSVTNKPLEDVIRVILAGQRLATRVLDEDTLLVYPNTPEKARDYQELVIRTFYLGNAEAAKVVNLMRSVVKIRDVHVDEKLNLLVIRDTAEVVRLAERVIANVDVAEPEVMLELEVLEVTANKLREVGLRLADTVSWSVTGANGPGQLTIPEIQNRNAGLLTLAFTNPLAALVLKQSSGDANLLANPRVRIKNRQIAKVLVGERVPVITTTTTANVGTSESVSYLDVGLKLELEPVVSLDDEVSMKVALEVSSITGVVTRTSGLQAFRLGTRNASTVLRVRDGETQVLGGLIQREDRRSGTGVPGLSDLPVLGRLFADTTDNDSRSEIVLLITPRVVRNVVLPGPERLEILSGTEAASGSSPIQLGAPMLAPSMPGPGLQPPGLPPAQAGGPWMAPPRPPPALSAPPLVPAPTGVPQFPRPAQ